MADNDAFDALMNAVERIGVSANNTAFNMNRLHETLRNLNLMMNDADGSEYVLKDIIHKMTLPLIKYELHRMYEIEDTPDKHKYDYRFDTRFDVNYLGNWCLIDRITQNANCDIVNDVSWEDAILNGVKEDSKRK